MPSSSAFPFLSLVAAIDRKHLLANEHGIPWRLPRDIQHYRNTTKDQCLLLGRRTYSEMLGWFSSKHLPLVLTSSPSLPPALPHPHAFATVSAALQYAQSQDIGKVYCCGGSKAYSAALPFAHELLLTFIDHQFPSGKDPVYFPPWPSQEWQETQRIHHPADAENPFSMDIVTLRRVEA